MINEVFFKGATKKSLLCIKQRQLTSFWINKVEINNGTLTADAKCWRKIEKPIWVV